MEVDAGPISTLIRKNLMTRYCISERMGRAISTGGEGREVRGDSGTLRALFERGMLRLGDGWVLTSKGEQVHAALQSAAAGEASDVTDLLDIRPVASGCYRVHTPYGTYSLDNCPADPDAVRAGFPSGPRWMLTWPGERAADAEFGTKRAGIQQIKDDVTARLQNTSVIQLAAGRCDYHDDDSPYAQTQAGTPSVPTEAAPTSGGQPMEGVIVTHAGFAVGSLPKHADHPDVRAALTALVGLAHAELTGDYYDEYDAPDTRGVVVIPEEDGAVRVYWLEGGQHLTPERKSWDSQLDIVGAHLERWGWSVANTGSTYLTARRTTTTDTPAVIDSGATVRTPRGDLGTVHLRMVGPYPRAVVNGVTWPASRVALVTSPPPPAPERTPAEPTEEEIYRKDTYVLEVSADNGQTWERVGHPPLDGETHAQREAQEREALSPEWAYRVIRTRRTRTVLPRLTPRLAAYAHPEPVPARDLRSGDRAHLRGTLRTVWLNTPATHGRAIYTVDEDTALFLDNDEEVRLAWRGPAVDRHGRPVRGPR
ncbi:MULTISPECIES: hypothetical protein [Streptomycetaceae]|uniref:Uncharacterized protein n=1 Tax=Streptantibioticus cattleyicolor (strain ATCC 35852 / DSM 46488 / JCM 4925 / NBRC 14057 / NRRL 8057) TaxID=1003195 RepID=F8JT26_STREN|nr:MULTISPECIES: hypothetical protein [Streptomycetaceae]AEW92960.1 hypothetical protein SCATT_05890 [Streptantibioticus cattleyicolor NRRL 8057 = DSM 46488]MYS57705.1 hypothetical protein [Streptomyces sp. SID5468]CCB73322.1 protein of unknown function [Streptantibioticus cattleyicolor NRRL 8057 = DSM 46488]